MENDNKKIITLKGEELSHTNLLRVEEVANKTLLIFHDGTIEESVLSIDVLEWELPKNLFIRIHPNHLINKTFSKKIFTIHTDWMELENGEKIPISKNLFDSTKSPLKKNKIHYLIRKLLLSK